MRSLIFGATGLIGSHLRLGCQRRGHPHLGTCYQPARRGHHAIDLRDGDAVRCLVADYEPDVVYLAAGQSCSAHAEDYPVQHRDITAHGTRSVADAVRRSGARLVLFTSDEVFTSGTATEETPADPANALGRSHAAAEAVARELLPARHLIVRTGGVFGAGASRGFVAGVLRRLRRGEVVEAHARRHLQPTYAADLAEVALELVRHGRGGTFHAVGPERHTEFSLARLVAHLFRFDSDRVVPIDADSEPRPLGLRLDRGRLLELFGRDAIRPTADGLRGLRDATPALTARAA